MCAHAAFCKLQVDQKFTWLLGLMRHVCLVSCRKARPLGPEFSHENINLYHMPKNELEVTQEGEGYKTDAP